MLFAACGGPDSPAPPGELPGAPTAVEPFRLVVDAPGVAGEPAPIRIEGNPSGVEVRIRRAAAPLMLFESWFLPVSPATPPARWGEPLTVRLDGRNQPRWPDLRPGLHLVTATRGEERRYALLPVTDLSLVIVRSDDEVLVFVVESGSGAAVPGARVSIFGPLERQTGRTDSRGVFRATAQPGPEMRAIAFSDERIGIGSSVRTVVYQDDSLSILRTDREICAPGDRVGFAGVFRVRSEGRVRPMVAGDGRIRVLDGNGRVLFEEAADLGPGGTLAGTIYLPRTQKVGPITLSVEIGSRIWTRELQVRRAFPAPFTVEVTVEFAGDGPAVEPGLRMPCRIRARLPDRSPLAGATVHYSITRGGHPVIEGEGVLDEQGELRSSFPVEGEGEFEIQARVTGPDGQVVTRSRRVGTKTPLAGLRIVPESRLLDRGAQAVVRIIASGDGPITGKLHDGADAHPFRILEGQREAEVRFVPETPGRHPLSARAEDAGGRELRATEELWVLDGLLFAESGKIHLVADRDEVRPGEPVRLLLLLPTALSGRDLLETIEGRSLGPHHAETRFGPMHLIRFRAPRGLGDEIRYAVRGVHEGRLLKAEAVFAVREAGGGLCVEIREERSAAAAGQVTAGVTNRSGDSVPALVLFSASTDTGSGEPVGSFSPWLRTGPDGWTEAWPPIGGGGSRGATSIHALAAGLDGRVGRATLRTDGESGPAGPAVSPAAVSPATVPPAGVRSIESWQASLEPGTTDRWIVIPEKVELDSVLLGIHLTSTARSRLIPTLARLEQRPAGSTICALVPLLRLAAAQAFAAAGIEPLPGLSDDPEAARHALADLRHLQVEEGQWGHFAGDAPDPRLTVLVRRTIQAAGFGTEDETPDEQLEFRGEADQTTALDTAEAGLALLARIPADPPEEAEETLVRLRVNDAIVGSVRLVPGDTAREHRHFAVPGGTLRPGNNRIQFTVAGRAGVLGTVTLTLPGTAGAGQAPISISRRFLPRSTIRLGSRLTARITVTAKSPVKRVFVRCPIPDEAQLAAWPDLPEGVSFEERQGEIDFFIRFLKAPLTIDLPLVVTKRGTCTLPPALALLLEEPETRAYSEGETLSFE